MYKFRLMGAAVLAAALALGAARAADPAYEIVVASGTLTKADMGKSVTFVPDEGGKPGKQVVLAVAADAVFLEAVPATSAAKAGVKQIKAADLRVGQKETVAVVYAKVGDANHLLALAAGPAKLPKGFAVDAVRGVLNKADAGKTVTIQPFIDNKFGKQQDVAVLAGSKFFEMAPSADPKRAYEIKAAKTPDLTAKRQAVAVLFARVGDEPSVLALIAQPGKDAKDK